MRSRLVVLVLVVTVAAAGLVTWARGGLPGRRQADPGCVATAGGASYALDLEQAANATTVTAVGKKAGLPDHAVTVAMAAALQESKLHNLSHGDLDSLGLFQQRPSQGWGTPGEIMVPRYAANAFYQRLEAVSGWQNLAVTAAAQAVQHSAAPDAYAQWEAEARVLAEVLTGETPAGFTCHYQGAAAPVVAAGLDEAMTLELGPPTTGATVSASRGWTVSSWLIGHAHQYGIPSVAFAGQRWTASVGVWKAQSTADPHAVATVQIPGT